MGGVNVKSYWRLFDRSTLEPLLGNSYQTPILWFLREFPLIFKQGQIYSQRWLITGELAPGSPNNVPIIADINRVGLFKISNLFY